MDALSEFLRSLNHNNPLRQDLIRAIVILMRDMSCVNITKLSDRLRISQRTLKRTIDREIYPIFYGIQRLLQVLSHQITQEEQKQIQQLWYEYCLNISRNYILVWNGKYKEEDDDGINEEGLSMEYQLPHDHELTYCQVFLPSDDILTTKPSKTKEKEMEMVPQKIQTETDKIIIEKIRKKLVELKFPSRCDKTYRKFRSREIRKLTYIHCYDVCSCNRCERGKEAQNTLINLPEDSSNYEIIKKQAIDFEEHKKRGKSAKCLYHSKRTTEIRRSVFYI